MDNNIGAGRCQPACRQHSFCFSAGMVSNAVGALTVGSPKTVNLGMVGQSQALYFTATSGQTLAVNVSGISTTPANVPMWIGVYNSSGTPMGSPSPVFITGGETINLPNLAADTYMLLIAPQFPATSSMQVTLTSGLPSVVPTDGTLMNVHTSEPGQIGYLNFHGTAGQTVSLVLSNVVTTPSTSLSLVATNPDGTTFAVPCNLGASGCAFVVTLSQTGLYALTITPGLASIMSFSVGVVPNVEDTIRAGQAKNLCLQVPGQAELLHFTAAAGQTFALNVSGIATTPNTPMWIGVYNSSGAAVNTPGFVTGGETVNLRNLSADTYTVLIAPQYPATSSMQVSLLPGTLAAVPAHGTLWPVGFTTVSIADIPREASHDPAPLPGRFTWNACTDCEPNLPPQMANRTSPGL